MLKSLKCTRCSLHLGATNVKIDSKGSYSPLVLFVGEAPGLHEDSVGKPFVGKAGKGLDRFIAKAGLDPNVCRWTNVVRCIPWNDQGVSFRKPTDQEIHACLPYLESEIQQTNPVFVVPLGNTSLHALLPDAPAISKARCNRYYLELPTLKSIFSKAMKWSKSLGKDFSVPAARTTNSMRSFINLVENEGFPKIKQKTFTVIPTFHPSAATRGNTEYEKAIIEDLTYIAMQVHGNKTIPFDQYEYLDTLEKIKEKLTYLKELHLCGDLDCVAIDLETNGLNPYTHDDPKVLLWSISYGPGKAFTIPFQHRESPFVNDDISQRSIIAMMNDLFSEDDCSDPIPITNQNVKFDLHWMYWIGIKPSKIAGDCYLASWTLFNNNIKHDLESLATEHIGMVSHKEDMKEALEDAALEKDNPTMDDVDIGIVHKYCCADTDSALRLHKYFEERMKKEELLIPHNDICIPAILPVMHMERDGIKVDLNLLSKAEVEFEDRMKEAYHKLNEWGYGEEILRLTNQKVIDKAISKGKKPPKRLKTKFQLEKDKDSVQITTATKSMLLFDIIGLTPIKVGKTGPSTDKHVLEELLEKCMSELSRTKDDHWNHIYDVVSLLRQYSADYKMLTSYIKPIPSYTDKDSLIHTNFGIRTTMTGRFSCSNPSLHIFPWKSLAKQAIKPHYDNGLIVSVDFSQMELRCLASVTGDDNMIEAFNSGEDIHRKVSSMVLNKPMDEVLDAERRRIKTVVFGICYGRSAKAIAAQEKIPESDAQELINGFFAMFPKIDRWVRYQHRQVKRTNSVRSPFGFRRVMEHFLKDAEKERRAVNTPIQGSASDIGVIGLVNVFRLLNKAPKLRSTMFGFVHDSLLSSIYPGELWDVCFMCIKGMQVYPQRNVDWIRCPLKIDFEIGPSWGQLSSAIVNNDRTITFEDCKPEYHEMFENIFCNWDPRPICKDKQIKEVMEDGSEIFKSGSAVADREARMIKTITSTWEFPIIKLI